ncbi:MAG: insertion element IS1 protein InsB [Moraxellaceae bacterium]|jgi:insertion element IS1 protein InsB|tara:strand:- start:5121 stop:5426 length:306 start_codon:yes stop_codon:yes gene_type:complete
MAYALGKRDLKTAKKLRARLKQLKVHYGSISMDNWRSFKTAFKADPKQIGKEHTAGIESNNYRLKHRLRRAVRKTYCFSKKFDDRFRTFNMVFFYINYGFI